VSPDPQDGVDTARASTRQSRPQRTPIDAATVRPLATGKTTLDADPYWMRLRAACTR